jgi:hypothetical protein
MYKNDNRIVATLDAGGTNFVFGAMKAGEFIIDPVSVPSWHTTLTYVCRT